MVTTSRSASYDTDQQVGVVRHKELEQLTAQDIAV